MAEDLTGRRVLCSVRWLLHMLLLLLHLHLLIAEMLTDRLAAGGRVELATRVTCLVRRPHVDQVRGRSLARHHAI